MMFAPVFGISLYIEATDLNKRGDAAIGASPRSFAGLIVLVLPVLVPNVFVLLDFRVEVSFPVNSAIA